MTVERLPTPGCPANRGVARIDEHLRDTEGLDEMAATRDNRKSLE
jgi:hypothetical protein